MAFCTNCGGQISDQARFCSHCGQQSGGAPATGAPAAAPASFLPASATYAPSAPSAPPAQLPPIEYTIQGSNLQVARLHLKAGQEVYAEAGRLVYKTTNVQWETRMSGDTIGAKIWGAFKRKMMGESLFLTYFRAMSDGEVGFAGSYPGHIQPFELGPGQTVMVQRDSFVAAQSTARLDIALVKRLGAGFFGGEGFILEKLTGPGTCFIHGGGDFVEFNLKPGEMLQVDTGCIVAFDEGVTYDIQMVGGIKTAIFGGEGVFLATLTGPGRVIVQSMTLEKMRRELAPVGGHSQHGDERHGIAGKIGSIFDSDD